MTSPGIMEITKESIEGALARHRVLVVDCWAGWCGPCRVMAPIFDKVAEEQKGKAAFGKMDCDRNPELVKRFEIMAIPTLLFFKDGQLQDTEVGLVAREDIEAKIGALQ